MSLLFLTFVFPLIGFLLLASLRDRLSENLQPQPLVSVRWAYLP
jgi:hypothetical protein